MDMEQEDAMWKIIYHNIQRQDSKKIQKTEHELKIQQVDGGFFEKFGSLMREHSDILASGTEDRLQDIELSSRSAFVEIDKDKLVGIEEDKELVLENEEEKLEVVSDEEKPEAGSDEEKPEAESGAETTPKTDSDNESEASRDTDSEPEIRETSDYVSVGWNIDELYLEILFEILHNVGCDVSVEIGQTALFSYIQEAFKMNNDKHTELMTIAEQKEAPEIMLNVEVIEAKELLPKDSNGLSDPFVTLYLLSNTAHRYNTSVKDCTLDPVWEEHFGLPVSENAQEDTLCLEVWDFDPAETVREKLGKINQVKGVKGLRKLVKEIAYTVATGQHENELIGKALIPLKAIPATGLTMWYSLDKKGKTNKRGVLKTRLAFSSEKNSQVASQEHRHLLKILLLHELEMSKVTAYWWCGNFSSQADAILTQHGVQSGLNETSIAFQRWAVYCSVHVEHPLSFTLFFNLLEKLIKPIQSSTVSEEDVKSFWDATKKLLPSCFTIIRKIRKKTSGDKNMMKQLVEVLKLLGKLSLLEPPENVDMFPDNIYGWLDKAELKGWDLHWVLTEAINQGANHWFSNILEMNAEEEKSDEGKLQHLIKIIQLVRSDLQRAVEYYDKIFQENVEIKYAKTLYSLYEAKLTAIIEPDVIKICNSLEKLIFPGHIYPGRTQAAVNPEEPLAMGTTLFELYLVLQRFVVLGQGLSPTEYEHFAIRNFHLWFHGGVAQWLNIAVYKTLQIIKKAVELDNLVPVDSSVKYSSSAVDTLTTFYQVKTFWQQLNWPDVEGGYTFVAKIIDDICRCCVYFADTMSARVEGMGDVEDAFEKKFDVTSEWCLAINNIDYVRQSLKPFTEELDITNILQQLSDLKGPMDADRCRQTINNVIENAIDTVRNKIIELLETVVKKISPSMTKLLIEGAEILHQDSNSIDKVMRYLDSNLATLHEYLNDENFNRMLEIFWENLSKILHDILQSNLDKRRPPSFFANLHETLKLMVRCFKQGDTQTDGSAECDDLKRIEHLLALNGMETCELIHQVQLERWREQRDINNSLFGQLTVKLKFQGNELKIEVMNARNLKAMDSNGSTDSFIRIHLLPEEKFSAIAKPKTKIHYKNLFPLYDEVFTIELTPEQRKLTDALVLFSVKDKDLFMSNQYIAEAYVHFLEIPETTEPLDAVPQMLLELHRPTVTDNDAIKALEHRQGDKLAKEFVKKLKQKIGAPTK